MQLHEYQAKEILNNSEVPIPNGKVAKSGKEAQEIALSLGGNCVVKAQVHAGGRGKAGGAEPNLGRRTDRMVCRNMCDAPC